MIIQTNAVTPDDDSVFASDLRLNGFPTALHLVDGRGCTIMRLGLRRTHQDPEGDVTHATYDRHDRDGDFTIWND